jgi:hypothetical protein
MRPDNASTPVTNHTIMGIVCERTMHTWIRANQLPPVERCRIFKLVSCSYLLPAALVPMVRRRSNN